MISRIGAFIATVLIALSALFQPVVYCYPVTGVVQSATLAFAEKYIRTELYFGLSRKGGPDVTEKEFGDFVDDFVTPRFPGGLTILDAHGQWREDDAPITKERTKVLILIHQRNERHRSNTKIEEIRAEYKKRFSQQSVLRLDIRKGINVDF